jgi:hypothetical protein
MQERSQALSGSDRWNRPDDCAVVAPRAEKFTRCGQLKGTGSSRLRFGARQIAGRKRSTMTRILSRVRAYRRLRVRPMKNLSIA